MLRKVNTMTSNVENLISFRRLRRAVVPLMIVFIQTIFGIPSTVMIEGKTNSNSINNSSPLSIRLKGNAYELDWDDIRKEDGYGFDDDVDDRSSSPRHRHRPLVFGFGREFALFESPRGGARNDNDYYDNKNSANDDDDYQDGVNEEEDFLQRMERYREKRRRSSPSSSSTSSSTPIDSGDGYYLSRNGRPPLNGSLRSHKRKRQSTPRIFQKVQNWWRLDIDPKIQRLPKIVCRVEPSTTLKLRKTFRPLKTIIRLGADYNTQQGVWQFKSSWEDAIIGGKLTLSGNRELQLTKSWQLSMGAVEDLFTRLRFRAAINLQTFQGTVRVGFRTERLTPIDVVEGFSILKRLPLDGSGGNLKLEVKANVALPEPEIEYSTEAQRALIGMGNIGVSIDEMNLLLDY